MWKKCQIRHDLNFSTQLFTGKEQTSMAVSQGAYIRSEEVLALHNYCSDRATK